VDISMALRAGAPAVLVLSGTATREELDGTWQPTATVNDVTEVPALLGG
jgi:phosphoglycolate phosphatase-like HAD superfamily hydrolase